jgi:hypothetical protein
MPIPCPRSDLADVASVLSILWMSGVDVAVSWVLMSVEASQRALLIQYYFGGPIGPPLRIVVEEDSRSVQVYVTMLQAKDPLGWPSVGRGGQALVNLESPIAGRRVFGPTREQMRARVERQPDSAVLCFAVRDRGRSLEALRGNVGDRRRQTIR